MRITASDAAACTNGELVGPDAAADGLAAVGDDRIQLKADPARHVFEQALEALRGLHGAHLGRGPHGDVQDQMGRTGSHLL